MNEKYKEIAKRSSGVVSSKAMSPYFWSVKRSAYASPLRRKSENGTQPYNKKFT